MSTISNKTRSFITALKGKGALAIVSGNFLTKAAAFLGSIILVRLMSKSDYGVLSSLENIYTYLYLLTGFGLNNAVLRWMVLKNTSGEKRGILDYVVTSGTAVNVAIVIGAIVGVMILGDFFSSYYYLFPLMLIALPFQFLFDTGTFSLRALFKNRAFAILSIIAMIFVWTTKVVGVTSFGLMGAIASWPFAYVLIAAIALCCLYFVVFRKVKSIPVTSSEKKAIKRYSLQYMITNGMWALYLQNDLLMINLFTGSAEAVADYRVAYVFPTVIALLSSSIGMFVAPYFIRNEKNKEWVWKNYKRVLGVNIIAVGVVTVVILALLEPLIAFVYGAEYLNIVFLSIIILGASFLNNGIRYVSANLLAAMGRIHINMAIAFCGIVAQITLNILLIPNYGVYGAAITNIIVYGAMAVVVTAYFIKIFHCKKFTK